LTQPPAPSSPPGPPGPPGPTPTPPIDGSGTTRARCILAPNPSPMTLDGTNTWLIAEPGSTTAIVIDPGPEDEGHLLRVRDVAASAGQRVALIVLTHGHSDHSAGAARFAELTGAPVRAVDPRQRLGDEGLSVGDVLTDAGCELRVLATPGHSADSVCLQLAADGAVLTGDTVLGRGTTVIGGDGSLVDYLASLRRLRALADETDLAVLLPGHGPLLDRPAQTLDYYLAHRAERLDEVRAALAAGDATPDQIVERVYAAVPRSVWGAARVSVRAQLDFLARQGEVPPGVTWREPAQGGPAGGSSA
jgi:glyoxylase-like metal-dependent hydrolase (beta-lactamase superfamily II)